VEEELTVFRLIHTSFILVLVATAASCTLGKNYERPDVRTPSTYRAAPGQPSAASLADLQWFELFRDDALVGLVKTALQENFELRIAAQRVLQARAAYGITRAGQWPSVDASADVITARSSQVGANRGIPAGTDTDVSYAQAGFSLSWELDVWGRLRRLSEAGRAQYLATEEARRGVITTLFAYVGQTYLSLRSLVF
jgi:outer membrane protein TolC